MSKNTLWVSLIKVLIPPSPRNKTTTAVIQCLLLASSLKLSDLTPLVSVLHQYHETWLAMMAKVIRRIKRRVVMVGMVAHTINLSTQDAKAGESL